MRAKEKKHLGSHAGGNHLSCLCLSHKNLFKKNAFTMHFHALNKWLNLPRLN